MVSFSPVYLVTGSFNRSVIFYNPIQSCQKYFLRLIFVEKSSLVHEIWWIYVLFNVVCLWKNAAKWRREHARSYEGCLPPKVVFHRRSSSSVVRPPTKVVFHRKLSSFLGCLPPNVVFHLRLSSTKGRLPPTVVFHQRLSSLISFKSLYVLKTEL